MTWRWRSPWRCTHVGSSNRSRSRPNALVAFDGCHGVRPPGSGARTYASSDSSVPHSAHALAWRVQCSCNHSTANSDRVIVRCWWFLVSFS